MNWFTQSENTQPSYLNCEWRILLCFALSILGDNLFILLFVLNLSAKVKDQHWNKDNSNKEIIEKKSTFLKIWYADHLYTHIRGIIVWTKSPLYTQYIIDIDNFLLN
jgi:hypothetical protein